MRVAAGIRIDFGPRAWVPLDRSHPPARKHSSATSARGAHRSPGEIGECDQTVGATTARATLGDFQSHGSSSARAATLLSMRQIHGRTGRAMRIQTGSNSAAGPIPVAMRSVSPWNQYASGRQLEVIGDESGHTRVAWPWPVDWSRQEGDAAIVTRRTRGGVGPLLPHASTSVGEAMPRSGQLARLREPTFNPCQSAVSCARAQVSGESARIVGLAGRRV